MTQEEYNKYLNKQNEYMEKVKNYKPNPSYLSPKEEKKIPEKLYGIINPKEGTERVPNNQELMFKINEIIDYLKSKGE